MKIISFIISIAGIIQTSMFYYYGVEVLGFYPTRFEFIFLMIGIMIGVFMVFSPLLKSMVTNCVTHEGEQK